MKPGSEGTPTGQFRRLVAFIADGIVVLDGDGKVRYVNSAAEALLGKSGRDLIGRDFGFPRAASEDTVVQVVRDGKVSVLELRCAEIEWDGEPSIVASLRDVTERADLAQRQAESIERLRELDELKTEFVSMVSHDLRSPMATIAGYADTLRFNWDAFDDAKKMKILERISRSTGQLAKLVENVLQVSQIESGSMSYDLQELDLAELIRRVAHENTQPVFDPDQGRRIDVRLPDDLPKVRADEMRQWQILTNFVTNALKFSPEDEPVEVTAALEDDHVRVSICDHGTGIHRDDMSKLFKKFSRLEQPHVTKVKGTGLGLYICKAMIEGQGGRVWVESEPGKGSTFSYTIPIAD